MCPTAEDLLLVLLDFWFFFLLFLRIGPLICRLRLCRFGWQRFTTESAPRICMSASVYECVFVYAYIETERRWKSARVKLDLLCNCDWQASGQLPSTFPLVKVICQGAMASRISNIHLLRHQKDASSALTPFESCAQYPTYMYPQSIKHFALPIWTCTLAQKPHPSYKSSNGFYLQINWNTDFEITFEIPFDYYPGSFGLPIYSQHVCDEASSQQLRVRFFGQLFAKAEQMLRSRRTFCLNLVGFVFCLMTLTIFKWSAFFATPRYWASAIRVISPSQSYESHAPFRFARFAVATIIASSRLRFSVCFAFFCLPFRFLRSLAFRSLLLLSNVRRKPVVWLHLENAPNQLSCTWLATASQALETLNANVVLILRLLFLLCFLCKANETRFCFAASLFDSLHATVHVWQTCTVYSPSRFNQFD